MGPVFQSNPFANGAAGTIKAGPFYREKLFLLHFETVWLF
jgi:hypothetical protein